LDFRQPVSFDLSIVFQHIRQIILGEKPLKRSICHFKDMKSTNKACDDGRLTFSHSQLGELTGRLVTLPDFPEFPVVQFRSIPYATIPKRFLPSILLKDIPAEFDKRPHRDFTNFGAACPQPSGTTSAWHDPYGGPFESDHGMMFDEFTCLTVSISVPESHISSPSSKLLPIMVYVHGGGAQDGFGHVDGLHSNAPLTSYAASISEPVILVNIGYRLNWLGGLICHDLLDSYGLIPTSAHGPFNLSLQDQRNAFAWVHEFIGGFGGDSSNITAFGESAGSVYLAYHICGSSTRLFDRAILQSGIIFGDIPLETKDTEYNAMLKYFNIEGKTAEERLDALRMVDADTLVKFSGVHLMLYVGDVPGVKKEDSLFTRGPATTTAQMDLIPTCEWLGDIVIGDSFWEGFIFFYPLQNMATSDFINLILAHFPKPEAEALLAAYEIPLSGVVSRTRVVKQMSLLLGDVYFSGEIHHLTNKLASQHSGKKRNIYRYSFGLSNPFPGSNHSYVTGHHFVEILFVFLTLLDRYPTHRDHWLKRQAFETARRWVTFANGQEPWDKYIVSNEKQIGEAKIAICDDLAGWTVRLIREDEEVSKLDPWGERRYAGWDALVAGLEALKANAVDAEQYNQQVTALKLTLILATLSAGHTQSSNQPDGIDNEN
jgi:carboxylesterase type B